MAINPSNLLVKPEEAVTLRSNVQLMRLDVMDLDLMLKDRRLRRYGHVERSSGPIKAGLDKGREPRNRKTRD